MSDPTPTLKRTKPVAPDRYLVLADVGELYETAGQRPTWSVLAPLASYCGAQAGDHEPAVIYLRADELAASQPPTLYGPTGMVAQLDINPAERLWEGAWAAPTLVRALRSAGVPDGAIADLTPVAVIQTRESNVLRVAKYSCTRLREVGAQFARSKTLEFEKTLALPDVLREVLDAKSDAHSHMIGETSHYIHEAGNIEIETKINLLSDVTPSHVSGIMAASAARGALTGFIPDVGNEYQRWVTRQSTYEVRDPIEDRGYIALLRMLDGTTLLKRKRFQQDGRRREETFRPGLRLSPHSYDEFLTAEYSSLHLRRLEDFRRVKFDVNVERSRSGRFYGIEIDEVVTTSGRVLRQLEVEYHRSRVIDGDRNSSIDDDIDLLTDLALKILRDNAISAQRTYYSKLSFLRDIQCESG